MGSEAHPAPALPPVQICGTTLTAGGTRPAAAPRNGRRGRACRRRRTSRCDRRRPCSSRTGAGPSSRRRWDRRTSVPEPGARRGGGTVPAPSCSSRLTCRLRLAWGRARAPPALAWPCPRAPLPRPAGSGALLAADREGEAQKGPQLLLEGKERLSHPSSGAVCSHRTTPACPSPQLAGAFDCPCGRGGGVTRDTELPDIPPGPAEPPETRVLLRCGAPTPGTSRAQELAAVLFYMIL